MEQALHEYRRDPVTGRWVIIAANRDARPNQFQPNSSVKADTPCPFCADRMMTPPMVARYGAESAHAWQVCVVPNLYPILRGDPAPGATGRGEPPNMPPLGQVRRTAGARPAGSAPASLGAASQSAYRTAAPAGLHEVVIEAPTHVTAMSELSRDQMTWLLTAYRDRMQVMRDHEGTLFSLPIKNSGPEAGASLEHVHSQILGLPFVPPYIAEELSGAADFLRKHGECVFCCLIREEASRGERVVAVTEDYLAWCPFASRFGCEVWVAPRTHQARFEATEAAALEKLGGLLQEVMRKIEAHPRISAYNYYLHSTPFDIDRNDHYHWHIEIIPRIAKAAGFEWGTGVSINSVAPERAAAELREQA